MLDNTAGGSTDSSAIIFASGGDTYQRAKIVSTVEGASAYLGNLGFYTGRSDTTGVTEKVRITGSGQLLISDGLVGTPSLSFINDTDTGMWRPGVNQLRLVTGGTDAIIIDSSQHVGVYVGGVRFRSRRLLVLWFACGVGCCGFWFLWFCSVLGS